MRGVLFGTLIAFGWCQPAWAAQQSHQSEAALAFALAIADLKAREGVYAKDTFSFTQEIRDDEGNHLIRRFHNAGNKDEWAMIESKGKDLSELEVDWSVPLSLRVDSMEQLSPQLCAEGEDAWIFCTETPLQVDSAEPDIDVEAAIQQGLQTNIYVDKNTGIFTRMHIQNREVMRPSPLAKIEKFEVQLEFAPAWPQGPLVTHRATRTLVGSYGFFISIDEQLTQTQYDFSPAEHTHSP